MSEFTVLYRGVPIGTAARTVEVDDPFTFAFLDFVPSDAYAIVRPTVQLASEALANFGYLGAAADPRSDTAGREAYAAARVLWDELELADASGRRLAGRVAWLTDAKVADRTLYWLSVDIDEVHAAVLAQVGLPPRGTPNHGQPAV